ncbi:MAG: ABC transporter permease [Deltaproteobacteria bacterium]|nr:ABC transporter permease [Deltaproteobacteria bacterium]
MMGRILALVRKDLQLFFRDPRGLMLVFLMPFMFIVIMRLAMRGAYGDDDAPIRVLAVVEDRGDRAASVLGDLEKLGGFAVETARDGRPLDRAAAAELVADGERPLAVIFPPGFSQALEAGPGESPAPAVVEVMIDPASPVQLVQPLVGTLQGMIERSMYLAMVPRGVDLVIDWVAPQTGSARRAELQTISRQATAGVSGDGGASPVRIERVAPPGMAVEKMPDSFQQNIPGYTVFGIFWIVSLIAHSIHDERRQGTFRRLLVAPLGRGTMLAGKLIPFFLVNLLQAAVMLGAAGAIFGVGLGHSPAGLLVVAVAAAAASSGLGVLVSAFARTEAQIGGLTTMLLLALSAVGGCFVPRVIMPDWLRTVGLASPHAWALDGFQDILVRGQGVVDVLPRAGALLAFAAVFFLVGVWRFRFE